MELNMNPTPEQKRARLAQALRQKTGTAKQSRLSFAQQRLWLLDQFEPGNHHYNMATAVRLLGALDVSALERGIQEIVRRHQVLRATFPLMNNEPVQNVASTVNIALPLVDLCNVPGDEYPAALRQLAREEACQPFNLANGPLLRVKLLRRGATEHVFLLTMHHIISDGWSMQVFVKELVALYDAFSQERLTPLAPLAIQYSDFAQWQFERMQSGKLQEQLAYWKQQLSDAPQLLELPADRPRPAVQTYRGASKLLTLSASLSRRLDELSRRNGATLFMTLLAAFQTLLHRYSGQTDICIGTPIAGRNRAEIENLIGCFLNTLVLRTRLDGDPTFNELVKRVREVALGAYTHQDVPFEKLVEELQPERSLSHTPLFQVWFNLLNISNDDARLQTSDVKVKSIPSLLSEAGAKFDLTLYAKQHPRGLQFSLVYNTDLFDEATIERMLRHFENLLEAAASNPNSRISALRLLTEDERSELSARRNTVAPRNPFVEFREQDVEQTITARFEQQAEKNSFKLAVQTKHHAWTYGELNTRAGDVARAINAGIASPKGERIALLFEHDAPMIAALIGTLKAGHAYVPLDPSHPRERLAYLLQDSRASAILTNNASHALAARLAGAAQLPVINIDDAAAPRYPPERNPGSQTTPGDIAYLLYTSGSTGQPKGVMQNHRNVLYFIRAYTNNLHICDQDRLTLFSSYGFDAAIMDIFGALLNGASLYPLDIKESGLAHLSGWLNEQKITVYHSTPTLYRYFLQTLAEEEKVPHLRLVVLGGEEVRSSDVDLYRQHFSPDCIFVNGFGPTESTLALQYFINREAELHRRSVAIGYPIEGTEVLLLNESGASAGLYGTGEITIRSPHVALGYWQKPDLTRAAFLRDLHAEGLRLYRTGDLGRLLPDGSIEYIGRKDFQVKIRGFRVELGEVEAALCRHPGISEVVAVALNLSPDANHHVETDDAPRPPSEKQLVAYIVADGQQHTHQLTTPELRQYLREHLPEYMIPSAIVLLDELPLNQNGKVDRRALPPPKPSNQQHENGSFIPHTPIEEVLSGIFADVLKLERVAREDDFFDLGGHSLLATQVISRLRDAFSLDLPLRLLFEAPSPHLLGIAIEEALRLQRGLLAPPILAVPRDAPLPLSFAQQRLWLIDQLEPASPVYNIPVGVRLKGALDIQALQHALDEIVRRHESLRTTFSAHAGQPLQIIHPPSPMPLPLTDLGTLPPDARDAEARRLAAEEAQLPFDLSVGPLLRARLLRLSDDEHVALLTMHHIVSDGWSTGVLVRELTALYEAYGRGEESPLEELRIQYGDYAVWQREWMSGEVLEQELGYWREQLAGAPAVLELPTDRVRPAVQSYRGASETLRLNAEVSEGLRKLSRQEGVTLFMTLLAAFNVLLHRYSHQEDIVVGTPIAGRNRSEIEPLIGFFVNTLALRTQVSGNPRFVELLERVKEVTLGAYAHQEMPFEKLVEELEPERSLSHAPLFQVMLVLQNAPRQELKLSGMKLGRADIASETVKFDLTLSLVETGQGMSGALEYSADLFDVETARRMARHFEVLVEGVVGQPESRISELPVLTEAEREQLLVEWNETQREYENADRNVVELFAEQSARTPRAVAVVYQDERLTYEELNQRANQLAASLMEMGTGKGSYVPMLMTRSVELVIAMLAVLKTGAAFVPLDIDWPVRRTRQILADLPGEIILVNRETPEWEEMLGRRFQLVDAGAAVEAEPNPAVRIEGEDPIYVIYTSGSTGKPKGVVVPHRGITNRFLWMNDFFGREMATALQTTRHIYDSAVWQLLWPLINGGKTVIPTSEMVLNVDYLLDVIEKYRVTITDFVPSVFNTIVPQLVCGDGVRDKLKSLRTVIIGGEEITPTTTYSFMERFPDVRVVNLYGPTEASIGCICHEMNRREEGQIPIGRPISNVQVLILDRHRNLLPVGVPGEIYLGGVCLAHGYINEPEKTAAVFVNNPFPGIPGDRLYKTGDMARYRPDGQIDFLGRFDEQVKIRGHRVEPGEVEMLLRQQREVRDCAVIARDDAGDGQLRLVAYVVPHVEKASPNTGELRGYLREQLPEYMIPTVFVTLDELPLTSGGKLDRRALPAPDASALESQNTYVAPHTPVQETVAAIWSELLKVERISVRDNFFELGGHSLLATQLISRLRAALNIELPLRSIFESPTVAELSSAIEELQTSPVDDESIARMLTEIEQLSEDETDSLLKNEAQ